VALSHVVSEIFNIEKIATLKSQSRANQGSLKVGPFDKLAIVSY